MSLSPPGKAGRQVGLIPQHLLLNLEPRLYILCPPPPPLHFLLSRWIRIPVVKALAGWINGKTGNLCTILTLFYYLLPAKRHFFPQLLPLFHWPSFRSRLSASYHSLTCSSTHLHMITEYYPPTPPAGPSSLPLGQMFWNNCLPGRF